MFASLELLDEVALIFRGNLRGLIGPVAGQDSLAERRPQTVGAIRIKTSELFVILQRGIRGISIFASLSREMAAIP